MTTEQEILHAVRHHLGGRGRVVLAVSGGLDSMSLLDAASRVTGADRIVVATFDHGTGEPARAAASFVCARAADLGVGYESGRASRSLRSEGELRDARWAFLRAVAKRHEGVIATAHTADDHVETVLMRVLRGAGARGLAGMHATHGPLRPFLEISRADLDAYARGRNLRWMEDPSNDSPIFLRNRVRRDLLPALRSVRPSLPEELLRISREAARWRRDVDAFVAAHIAVHGLPAARSFEVSVAPLTGMSSAELSVLWPAIGATFALMLDRRGISRLAEFTLAGRVGSRIQLSGGWSVIRSRDGLTFSASSHVAPASVRIDLSARTVWGAWSFRRRGNADGDAVWSSPLPSNAVLTVRAWEPGDKMRSAQGPIRKVKQLLSRAGVTGHKRAGWPVVLAGDEIVWIPGVRRSKITERLGTAGVPFICELIDR
jgi:tRNA(Ile)-lysidine synthase